MGLSSSFGSGLFAAWPLSSGSWTHVTESGTIGPAGGDSCNGAGAGISNVPAISGNPVRRHHADSTYLPHNAEVGCKVTQDSLVTFQSSGLFLKAQSTSASTSYYQFGQQKENKTGTANCAAINRVVSGSYTQLVADTDVAAGSGASAVQMRFRAIERASDVLLQAKIWLDGNSEPDWPTIVWTGSVTANPADGVIQVLDSTSGLWDQAGSVGLWNQTYTQYPTFVASRGGGATGSTATSTAISMSAGGSITVGNYLILKIAMDNAGTNGAAPSCTITDPRSNTWTVVGPANQDPGAANAGATCYIAYAKVANAYSNGDSITVNHSPTVPARAYDIEEYSNINETTPVSVSATTATGGSTTPSISRTGTRDGEMFFGALAIEGPTGDTFTQDSDTTNGTWSSGTTRGQGSGTSAMTLRYVAKSLTASGAQTWNPTLGTSRNWAQVALIFQNGDVPDVTTSYDDFSAVEMFQGTLPVAGDGLVTVTGRPVRFGTLPIPITDTVAVSGRPTKLGTLPVVGGGLVTIAGTPTVLGTLPVLGGGVVTVNGTPTVLGTLPIVGGSVVSINGHPVKLGTLAIAGGGLVTVTGHRVGLGIASFVDGGHIDVTGVPIVVGTISLSGGGQVLITGTIITPGAGLLAIHGGGALTIAGHREGFGVIDFDLADTIQVAGSRVVVGNTTIFGGGLVLVDGFGYKAGTVQITGGGAVDIDAFREVVGDLLIAGGGQVRLGAVTIRILTQSKRIRVFSDNQFDATEVPQDDTMTVYPMGDDTMLVRPTE